MRKFGLGSGLQLVLGIGSTVFLMFLIFASETTQEKDFSMFEDGYRVYDSVKYPGYPHSWDSVYRRLPMGIRTIDTQEVKILEECGYPIRSIIRFNDTLKSVQLITFSGTLDSCNVHCYVAGSYQYYFDKGKYLITKIPNE